MEPQSDRKPLHFGTKARTLSCAVQLMPYLSCVVRCHREASLCSLFENDDFFCLGFSPPVIALGKLIDGSIDGHWRQFCLDSSQHQELLRHTQRNEEQVLRRLAGETATCSRPRISARAGKGKETDDQPCDSHALTVTFACTVRAQYR